MPRGSNEGMQESMRNRSDAVPCDGGAPVPSTEERSITEKLETVLGNLPPDRVTLEEIRDLIGQDGLLLLSAFLTLVFLVPVSIPGVSTVFGAAILLIGISRLMGRNLWLPGRIARKTLPAENIRNAIRRGAKWLRSLEKVSRPHRMSGFVTAPMADMVNSCAMIAGAVLLMAPFGLVPFSNTLPALALLFLAIGLLQKDGLHILCGHLLNVATVIYFSVLIVGGGVAIREVFRRLAG